MILRFLAVLALCAAVQAQSPVLRNAASTNQPPKLDAAFPTLSTVLRPLTIPNGTTPGSAASVFQSGALLLTGTNAATPGDFTAWSGGFSNSLTLNGANVLTNASGGGTNSVNTTNVFPFNLKNTASVQWGVSGSNVTAEASSTGDTTATNIVTLTQTGTNVSSMDFSLVQRGGVFKLVMTGNAYIGAPSGVANTAFTKAWLMVQQPSTGTCTLKFTNGFYAFSEGVAPVIDTNNGAVSVFEFVSDVFTNGLLHGSVSTPSKLIP